MSDMLQYSLYLYSNFKAAISLLNRLLASLLFCYLVLINKIPLIWFAPLLAIVLPVPYAIMSPVCFLSKATLIRRQKQHLSLEEMFFKLLWCLRAAQ